ncbi:MAG TPA: NAD-dependent epimerase/dehydratase family protein [Verrucomicrobiae bacterium]|jgi:nucleoside-diphosphate-sugar epimerase|nr:NAD-dependent epimerase/dehydratase family protein [Verrucomicrobiae bacterium]
MAKYLVTGGLGFVGSHLSEELVNQGHDITILDNLSNGQLSNISKIKDKVTVYIAQVEQLQSTIFNDQFDGVFHLATAPRSSSLADPMRDIESNCKGMIAVLELAKRHGAKVVFTSNSGIYGSSVDGSAINESSVNNPTTPYDANKLVSEYYSKIYYNIYGVKSALVRFATVYGERQKVNEKLNWRPLVATFVKNVVNNESVKINGDGEQTRDLIYVKDAVQGVIKAMNSSVDNADVFLLSTNTETSVKQVLDLVENIVGKKANVNYDEPLKGDIKRMRYDYSKAKEYFGYEPKYSVRDGISKIVEYMQ